MGPCLLGYGEIGVFLFNDPNTKRGKFNSYCYKQKKKNQKMSIFSKQSLITGILFLDGNPYWRWIKNYADDSFQSAVTAGKGKINKNRHLVIIS